MFKNFLTPLVLIRHAHRETEEGRHHDNGLSPKGLRQVEKILSYWDGRTENSTLTLLSSPKRRCIETIAPLAERLDYPLKIESLLDEQGPRESHATFVARIEKCLKLWQQEKHTPVFACSHGDWIPTCVHLLSGEDIWVKKGAWFEWPPAPPA